MYDCAYHRPRTLDEARRLLEDCNEASLLAGGMTLLPTMKLRLAHPSDLVDLAAIPSLRGIREYRQGLEIGAMTCHADVAADARVRTAVPALARLAGDIGDPQVRNRGTIGGSLANSDPAADYPAAVLALDATIVTDRREIPADAYFLGLFETALEPGEIIVALRFPYTRRAAYAKFPQPASRYAIVGVMVAESDNGVRIAISGAGSCAFRVPDFERALADGLRARALEGLSVPPDGLNEDIHAPADYRAHLVGVMARRAVRAAAAT